MLRVAVFAVIVVALAAILGVFVHPLFFLLLILLIALIWFH